MYSGFLGSAVIKNFPVYVCLARTAQNNILPSSGGTRGHWLRPKRTKCTTVNLGSSHQPTQPSYTENPLCQQRTVLSYIQLCPGIPGNCMEHNVILYTVEYSQTDLARQYTNNKSFTQSRQVSRQGVDM